jgi:BASS family bile acid:Na+ symporter
MACQGQRPPLWRCSFPLSKPTRWLDVALLKECLPMESGWLTGVLLPLALFIIMLGMGLGLTLEDFRRILIYPKGVFLGLGAQLLFLPIVGFALASLWQLSPELAVGLIILAACPGGPTSNLITFLAKGNVALSVTLTAISSLITVFTIPLVVNVAMRTFMGKETALQLPLLATMLQISLITILPVAIGMVLRQRNPSASARSEHWVKWLSLLFLGLIIAGVLLRERANVADFFLQVGAVTLALMAISMLLGYGLAAFGRLDRRSATAITIEVGIQNGTLAITIASASSFLNAPAMAIPAATYSLLMFLVSGLFAWWAQRRELQRI